MDENLSTSIQSPKSTIPCSPEVIITGNKKKAHVPDTKEQLMTILCVTGKLHMILLTKTDCASI